MLTARDTVNDRVTGLDAGADDYLVKPFALRGARGAAAGARPPREREAAPRGPRSTVGPIALDEARRRVTVDGRDVDLSPREFSLLECLLRHPGQTLTRDQLLDQPGRSASPSRPTPSTPTSTTCGPSSARPGVADRDRPRRRLPARDG